MGQRLKNLKAQNENDNNKKAESGNTRNKYRTANTGGLNREATIRG